MCALAKIAPPALRAQIDRFVKEFALETYQFQTPLDFRKIAPSALGAQIGHFDKELVLETIQFWTLPGFRKILLSSWQI